MNPPPVNLGLPFPPKLTPAGGSKHDKASLSVIPSPAMADEAPGEIPAFAHEASPTTEKQKQAPMSELTIPGDVAEPPISQTFHDSSLGASDGMAQASCDFCRGRGCRLGYPGSFRYVTTNPPSWIPFGRTKMDEITVPMEENNFKPPVESYGTDGFRIIVGASLCAYVRSFKIEPRKKMSSEAKAARDRATARNKEKAAGDSVGSSSAATPPSNTGLPNSLELPISKLTPPSSPKQS